MRRASKAAPQEFTVPIRITGTATITASSARDAHERAHRLLGGRCFTKDVHLEADLTTVRMSPTFVIYGPEGINEIRRKP
jgi:hypothetical protein